MIPISVHDILGSLGKKKSIQGTYALGYEDDLCRISQATLSATATFLEEMVLVTGTVTAEVKTSCSRCNQPLTITVSAELEDEYYIEEELLHGDARDRMIGRDDLQFVVDGQGVIDIEGSLIQALVTNIPLQQTCAKCTREVHYRI
jgi:uncharacterized metal-binding protein YceD (DUF177 family)